MAIPTMAILTMALRTMAYSLYGSLTLALLSKERRLRKGDRIWQLAFGSGFKCNSAVWKAMRNF